MAVTVNSRTSRKLFCTRNTYFKTERQEEEVFAVLHTTQVRATSHPHEEMLEAPHRCRRCFSTST